MNYTIRFTPEAEETFDALSAQLNKRWGEQYVREFEDRISKAVEAFSQTPYMYPIIFEELQVRKCVLHRASWKITLLKAMKGVVTTLHGFFSFFSLIFSAILYS